MAKWGPIFALVACPHQSACFSHHTTWLLWHLLVIEHLHSHREMMGYFEGEGLNWRRGTGPETKYLGPR